MELCEKIFTCRKKAGLTQEDLAQKVGVSRQAVSKWENGEAEPEISKLRLLAQTFGVTTDWLLSPDPEAAPSEPAAPDWAAGLPGRLGKLARKYGWLAGAYIAFSGGGMLLLGAAAKFASEAIMPPDDFFFGNPMPNPVAIMGKFIMALGAVVCIGGIILAIVLKKRSK